MTERIIGILGGMGPVAELRTTAGKLFAAGYALFSGLLFIVVAGILFGPVVVTLLTAAVKIYREEFANK